MKNQPFFEDVDWDKVIDKDYMIPVELDVMDKEDCRYFDTRYPMEVLEERKYDPKAEGKETDVFYNFDFVATDALN